MDNAMTIRLIVLLGLVFLLAQATYTVSETEQVIITQFGDPVGDPVGDSVGDGVVGYRDGTAVG